MHNLVIAFRHEAEGVAAVLPDFVGVKQKMWPKQFSALSLPRSAPQALQAIRNRWGSKCRGILMI